MSTWSKAELKEKIASSLSRSRLLMNVAMPCLLINNYRVPETVNIWGR